MVTDFVAEHQEQRRLPPPTLNLVTAPLARFGDPAAFRTVAAHGLRQVPVVVGDTTLTDTLLQALERPATGELDHYRFLVAVTLAFHAWRKP